MFFYRNLYLPVHIHLDVYFQCFVFYTVSCTHCLSFFLIIKSVYHLFFLYASISIISIFFLFLPVSVSVICLQTFRQHRDTMLPESSSATVLHIILLLFLYFLSCTLLHPALFHCRPVPVYFCPVYFSVRSHPDIVHFVFL